MAKPYTTLSPIETSRHEIQILPGHRLSLYIEFCADRVLQACGLDESTLLESGDEGRARALTMEHVRQRTDDSASSYEQSAA